MGFTKLKKNFLKKFFGYLARCEIWTKLGLRFWIFVGQVEILAKFGANFDFRVQGLGKLGEAILGFRVQKFYGLGLSEVDFWVWGFDFTVLRYRFQGLGLRVFRIQFQNFGKGFQTPISDFESGLSEPDFQNFDSQMPKIMSKSCFFVNFFVKFSFQVERFRSLISTYQEWIESADASYPAPDRLKRIFTMKNCQKSRRNSLF